MFSGIDLFTRLGIIKEMQPQYVATFSEKPAVLEGHPFVVEAGVSLGGAEVRAVVGMAGCVEACACTLRMSGSMPQASRA